MFELAGDRQAAAAGDARAVMRLETELARISRLLVERRDSLRRYHKIDRSRSGRTSRISVG
jgi:hypothetical protein